MFFLISENYLEARQKCKIAESQSDLLSDVDDKKFRKIRNKKPISSSSSDQEEQLPDPPQRRPIKLSKTRIFPLCSFI